MYKIYIICTSSKSVRFPNAQKHGKQYLIAIFFYLSADTFQLITIQNVAILGISGTI